MLLTGVPLALPYYANPAQAFADLLAFGKTISNVQKQYVAGGEFVDLPLLVFAQVNTDGAAGTRTPILIPQNADGTILGEFPGAATLGPAQSATYTWSVQLTTNVAGANSSNLMPLPLLPLSGGMTLLVVVSAGSGGDSITPLSLYVIRFPTNAQAGAGEPVAPVRS